MAKPKIFTICPFTELSLPIPVSEQYFLETSADKTQGSDSQTIEQVTWGARQNADSMQLRNSYLMALESTF